MRCIAAVCRRQNACDRTTSSLRGPYSKKKCHPFGWHFFLCFHYTIDEHRIMFRNNEDRPSNYHDRHSNDDKYFKLYYQFLKNAFGLKNIPAELGDVYIRVYLDQLPDTKEKCDAFKAFVRNLPNIRDFENVRERIHIRDGDVVDVCSHKHILLQCTDIVLGAMYFRLNDLHLEKPENSRTRGKRTIAKEKLYKHINARIRELLPGFNIGVSTGDRGYENPKWELPYKH